jgi:hypothetical protein
LESGWQIEAANAIPAVRAAAETSLRVAARLSPTYLADSSDKAWKTLMMVGLILTMIGKHPVKLSITHNFDHSG